MNKAKNPAKRGFFWIYISFWLSTVSMMHSSFAQTVQRSYWDRLLHAENGVSRVQSTDFFISPNGRNNLEQERTEFLKILQSHEGQKLACQFPARYKWLAREFPETPVFNLNLCSELQDFHNGFQKKTFYIAYVSEYLDAPASAFGHVMLVFRDDQAPLDLADTVHFAATTNREGALTYAIKGLSGGFEGYFIREPFFHKKKDYLLFEQRAIHLYKIDLSSDEIENMVFHLYELRKAKFQYYFIDENCAFQIAELLNVASPNKDYSLNTKQPNLPIDVIRLNANRISEKLTLSPIIVRQQYLAAKISESENRHVQAVINQTESVTASDSDQTKELLYLHYQYAFRRKRMPYPNHSEIEALDFKESSQHIDLPDPSLKTKKNTWSIGLTQSNLQTQARARWTPLGDDGPQTQISRESRLSILETTVDLSKKEAQLEELKLLSMSSTPNQLEMHQPWSWSVDVSANRRNPQKALTGEAEIGIGKTWIWKKIRIESWIAPGVNQQEQTKGYVRPKLVISGMLSPELRMSFNTSRKTFAHKEETTREWGLQYKNIQFLRRTEGVRENTLMMHLPF